MDIFFKFLCGAAVVALFVLLGAVIGGCFVWLASWLLHLAFANIPQLTFLQSVIIGVVLSIIGNFFKK